MPARSPPPSPEHVAFLRAYGPAITEVALAVRQLVLTEARGAVELVYDAYNAVASGYSFTGRPSDACIHIAVYARWVNLGFNQGAQLADPERRLQGSGNRIRHLRITTAKDLKDPAVRSFIRAAVQNAVYPPAGAGPKPVSVVRAIYTKRKRPTVPRRDIS